MAKSKKAPKQYKWKGKMPIKVMMYKDYLSVEFKKNPSLKSRYKAKKYYQDNGKKND